MNCTQCGRPLDEETRLACMSGSIMGDEHTDCYYFCASCQVYSIASWWDDFTGVETESARGPVAKERGDELVALIRQCARPWDKKCRCAAHREYFNDSLD